MRLISVLALGAVMIATEGCLATHEGRPVRYTKPTVLGARGIPGVDEPIPDSWIRVFIGPLPRPRLSGYVRTGVTKENRATYVVYWVYDADFNLVGNISENGITTRYDKLGNAVNLGTQPTDKSLLLIYDIENPEQNPVHMVHMPEPKS